MKLQISIEYKTAWGEELVLCLGGKRHALKYEADGMWKGEIARFNPEKVSEYSYEWCVTARPYARSGKVIRSRFLTVWNLRFLRLWTDGTTVLQTLHSILQHLQRPFSDATIQIRKRQK